MDKPEKVQTDDPFGVTDIFVSGLATVEDIGGGALRFVFFSLQHKPDGAEERIVVAKIIMLTESLPDAVLKSARACGLSVAMELRNLH